MDAIYTAWIDGRLSNREAVEAILYHSEYGGNRTDAEAVVREWAIAQDEIATQIDEDVWNWAD